MTAAGLLGDPQPFLFFTGKDGVGKASLSCTVALELVYRGKRALLMGDDPAPNKDEILGLTLGDHPTPIPGAPNLSAMNIAPDTAVEVVPVQPAERDGLIDPRTIGRPNAICEIHSWSAADYPKQWLLFARQGQRATTSTRSD